MVMKYFEPDKGLTSDAADIDRSVFRGKRPQTGIASKGPELNGVAAHDDARRRDMFSILTLGG